MTDEPNYDSKTMQPKMGDDPIASPTKDQITGNTVMQKIRSLIDNYLGWSKEITDKVNSLKPEGEGKTYTAGDGIAISEDDIISNTDHTQTQTNTSDIASIRVSMSDMASSAALGAETEARKSADSTLQTNIDKKQDKLSTAQQSALDSGITATKVQKYDAYDSVKQNTLNTAQMNAVNSGIDAAKVTKYDGYGTKITTLEGDMTSVEDSVSTLGTQIGTVDTKVDGKQNILSTSQLNAVDSGITATKVTTYDGYATTIAGKQDKLTAGSNITISSDNVISATGGSAGVTSFNTKQGAVTQEIDVIQDFIQDPDYVMLNYNRYTKTGSMSNKYLQFPNVSNSNPGCVSPYQKKSWDAKLSSIPTASASVLGGVKVGSGLSISNGVLSATGGGGGGASLPADGYYWEKITSGNWPTDWASTDVVMVYLPYHDVIVQATNWGTAPTSVTLNSLSTVAILICNLGTYNSLIVKESTKYVGMVTANTLNYTYWNSADSTTKILDMQGFAYNGGGCTASATISRKRNDQCYNGLYRLRKFSS